MSNLRRLACYGLADLMKQRLDLADDIAIISNPPSDVGEYPAVAIWLERFSTKFTTEDELTVNSSGDLRVGDLYNLGENPSGAAEIAPGARLSRIGTSSGSGRIWIGSRYAPARENLEDEINEIFTQDSTAPGRVLVSINEASIGGVQLPWSMKAAFFINDSEWQNELAFTERLWCFMRFDLEIGIYAARTEPTMIEQIILGLNTNVHDGTATTVAPADQELKSPSEYLVVGVDGTVSPYNP